ncbi:TolC family protein [Thiosocius teredinicola]|uniref:TolC family protein n=1 Tax=Thiosocius teredinicola TaxID=1973002 RepID=UPI000990C18C
MFRQFGGKLGALLLLVGGTAWAADELQPLPEPLALEDALQLADVALPAVELALAEREASDAALAQAESLSGTRLTATAKLRAIEPSYKSDDPDNNDSSARLALTKRIYDFGYSDALESAARMAGQGSEWRYLDARQQAHLNIMRSFLDVVLADLQFARDNEAMAGAFISADRARDRHELGRLSDVDLLRTEAEYQEALQLRNASQTLQRAARSRLALAMGRPGDLVSNVVRPTPPDYSSPPPPFDELLEQVQQYNPEILALRAEVDAALAGVEAARSGHGPVLRGELEANAYNRNTSSTHPLGAALVFEMPLLTGGAKDAAIAEARAQLRGSRAKLTAAQHRLRQEVLDLWLKLENLRVQLEGLAVRGDYRELYLDRSRALYELEVKTDLGDAMTEISAVRLDVARAEFDWMMTQARLQALSGKLLAEESDK